MSPRDCSWFLAGVLAAVAVTLLVFRPWESTASGSLTPSGSLTLSTSSATIPPSTNAAPNAAAHATSGDNAGSLDEVTQKLATRLAKTGGSDSEWMLLAQSYDYMGRTTEAAAARSHIANALPGAHAATDAPVLDGQTLATVADALDK